MSRIITFITKVQKINSFSIFLFLFLLCTFVIFCLPFHASHELSFSLSRKHGLSKILKQLCLVFGLNFDSHFTLRGQCCQRHSMCCFKIFQPSITVTQTQTSKTTCVLTTDTCLMDTRQKQLLHCNVVIRHGNQTYFLC